MVDNRQIKARKKARTHAMQGLYQWILTGQQLYEIEAQYASHFDMSKVDVDYFKELLYQVPKRLTDIDAGFTCFLDRPLDALTPIELAILRIGTYELIERKDVPYKVVINEAVGLSKLFGADEAHRYVNGILDKVAKASRQLEMD